MKKNKPVKEKVKKDKKNEKTASKVKEKQKRLYYEGVGRRKTAVARVRLFLGKESDKGSKILINSKPYQEVFKTEKLIKTVDEPLKKVKVSGIGEISATASGGGTHAIAQALRLGIARALIKYQPALAQELHALHFLTRDPRMKERKKPGLHGARRGQQWSKR
ncbi:MAG: 30S ribosomal protein S9 [Candidatus Portnoybacteria bacterium]|nr:30S ribosomal protein S9 [Candidatus Portnoybacteria bacterium]